jgi:pyrophosphate--fructose-6-phosphate 1-phosphotransferase
MTMLVDKLTDQEKHNSIFEQAIRELSIPVCSVFKRGDEIAPVAFEQTGEVLETDDSEKIAENFKKTVAKSRNMVLHASGTLEKKVTGKRVAVLFSGGPAAGGHNVVAGIKKVLGKENTLLGVKAGPKGLLKGSLFEVKEEDISRIINTGGFDFLGSDRTKIKTDDQFKAVKKTCLDNSLNGIIVIGGDDSNTNAALLAEYLFDDGIHVIGVPKTIDGDLQVGSYIPISFGFDTATKIYSELAGNILQDTPSSRKYWHFIKVMGRSASHVALEVALQTKPALCLISEEVAEKRMSLSQIIDRIADTVIKRAKKGVNHGCVIIPEGLIEFIPEMKGLITQLNEVLVKYASNLEPLNILEKRDFTARNLTPEHAQLFASMPDYIEEMLLMDRDSHGNLQVSLIPTEKLIIDMTKTRIKEKDATTPFKTQQHFFGYEGRCGAPSRFDAYYTYNLGLTAGSLILNGITSYMAAVSGFTSGGKVAGIPLTGLMNIEHRYGKDELVIKKALVTLDSPAFKYFNSRREEWSEGDLFASPGPRQFWGPASKQIPLTVALNQGYSDFILGES